MTEVRTSPVAPEGSPSPVHGSVAFWSVALLTGLHLAGLAAQTPPLNGAWYWKWGWRDLDLLQTAMFLSPPLLLLHFTLARVDVPGRVSDVRRCLIALAACNFLLQILAVVADPRGFSVLARIVESPVATGYYGDAERVTDAADWLGRYHRIERNTHSGAHPPGPILFYYALRLVAGPQLAPTLGALLIGLMGAAGTLVVYPFAGLWTSEARPRLLACAAYALMPGLVLFLPEFDQVYAIQAMAMAICLERALEGRARWAIALGGALFLSAFFAYNLLTMGTFLALQAAYRLWSRRGDPERPYVLLRVVTLSLGTCLLAYALLGFATGFNPIRSFQQSYSRVQNVGEGLNRPWKATVLWDLYDFLIGSGMICLPLLVLHGLRGFREGLRGRPDLVLSVIGLVTIAVVDLTGLLRAETARVWLFLQPLVFVPVGLELDRFAPGARRKILLLQWLAVVVIKARLAFINP
jgi:hypothetical protein